MKLLINIFLFVLFGIAPIAGLIWIFAAGNKKARQRAAEQASISENS